MNTMNLKSRSLLNDETVLSFHLVGKRKAQEDALFVSEDKRLLIVCDGVGGNKRGDLASSIVCSHIGKLYKDNHGTVNHDFFVECIHSAKTELDSQVHQDFSLEGLATTIAMVYIGVDHILTFHVGDSRIVYIDKSNKKVWASKDHSIVQELLDNGILQDQKDALTHPLRNRVTRVVQGTGSNTKKKLKVSTSKIKSIHEDDILILCTDGVLENLTSIDLAKRFGKGNTIEQWQDLELFCNDESQDNATALLFEF